MKKGDLIRNKNTGAFAIVMATYTKFFQDRDAYGYSYDYGVAGTAVEVKWVVSGHEHTFRKSKMKHNWEVISEQR